VANFADISQATLRKKIKKLLDHGFITIVERKRYALAEEKKYALTPRGRILAEAFIEIL